MIKDLAEAQNLFDVIQYHAGNKGDEIALVYLIDGEDHEAVITYRELDRQSRAFAATLQKITQPGDRALLLYPSGLEFIVAFLGCIYAGVVAVPTIVPHLKRATPRFRAMLADAHATVACTQLELSDKLQALFVEYPEFHDLKWIVSEQIESGAESDWKPVDIKPDELSFLQYTSGSTSTPKGAMITHFSLMETIRDLQVGAGVDERSK